MTPDATKLALLRVQLHTAAQQLKGGALEELRAMLAEVVEIIDLQRGVKR